MKKQIYTIFIVIAAGLLLSGCDKASKGASQESETVIEGTLSVTMSSPVDAISSDPNASVSVYYNAMIEYEPGHKAVIYTSAETEYVNVKTEGVPLAYFPRGKYRVEGTEVISKNAKKMSDGKFLVESPAGVDKWIEVSRMELLEKSGNQPEVSIGQ